MVSKMSLLLWKMCLKDSVRMWYRRELKTFLTFVLRSTDIAGEEGLASGIGLKQITTIRAEDERSNGSHSVGSEVMRDCLYLHVMEMLRDKKSTQRATRRNFPRDRGVRQLRQAQV